MIPFKNLPVNCGVPLLVAKIPSINDVHSLRILASLILSLKNIVLNLTILGALQYKMYCFSSPALLLMHFFTFAFSFIDTFSPSLFEW